MSIDIGLIDSGINPWHSHVEGVEGGIAFHLTATGEVVSDPDFTDTIGHGTALAGIIRKEVPHARIHAIKIFHGSLEAPFSLLFAALKWAITKNMRIINLSLGSEREEDRGPLFALCQKASDKASVVVSAAKGPHHQVFPASFPSVIGVYWNPDCDRESLLYHPHSAIEFGAYGRPRELPGVPEKSNFCGSSFSAAYVTARVGKILEGSPSAGLAEVKAALVKSATESPFPGDGR